MAQKLLFCSFCLRSQKDVKSLISNETEDTFICDACVNQCRETLNGTVANKVVGRQSPMPSPRMIKEFLDQYVIGQEHAKEVLAVAVYNHYKRLENPVIDGVEIDKSNILLCGPTGTGKTLLVQSIAKFIDVPIAMCDATSMTESGYVGDDVESIITRLLHAADNDIRRAERGIVLIDEADKKRQRDASGATSRDIAGESVQQGLLKLLEGTEIMVPISGRRGPNAEMVRVNTKNILFILGGAFIGLDKIIEQSLDSSSTIGYTSACRETRSTADLLRQLKPEHLIKYGLIPELIGRVPVICALNDLDEQQLVRVLIEPKNAIIKQYTKMFAVDGVQLQFDPEALVAVAKLAREQKTNGRALRGVLEHRLLRTQYNLPDLRDKGVERIIITAATITHGSDPEIIYGARRAKSQS
jgi:ATP-dependent Clp protease ATP-binding subunit ClpX